MHRARIVHLDIKPNNIMFVNKDVANLQGWKSELKKIIWKKIFEYKCAINPLVQCLYFNLFFIPVINQLLFDTLVEKFQNNDYLESYPENDKIHITIMYISYIIINRQIYVLDDF